MKYDYLIVGSGLYGAVCARELTDAGFRCLIIEKRNHIAGNCYTENIEDINIHKYGCHIFHTANKEIWEYINRFADFNNFIFRPKVIYKEKIYSFPLNLLSFYQVYGCRTPQQAEKKLESVRIKNLNPKNLEEWILDKVGEEIYEIFYKGYTIKQWGRYPKDLPISIANRIPIRFDFNDNYFNDRYQGIPIGGYTKLFEKLLDGINVELNTDYFNDVSYFNKLKVIYSGSLDEFFYYEHGCLEYRTLRFEESVLPISDYQGNAVNHYTDLKTEYNRIIEHKHFEFLDGNTTVITKVFPEEWDFAKERLYPINNTENEIKAEKYRSIQYNKERFIIGGRLGDYKYYDMDDVISLAISTVKKEIYGKK